MGSTAARDTCFARPFRINLLAKLTDYHAEDVLQKQHEQIISMQRQTRDKFILCDARLWYDDLGRFLYMALDDSLKNVISSFFFCFVIRHCAVCNIFFYNVLLLPTQRVNYVASRNSRCWRALMCCIESYIVNCLATFALYWCCASGPNFCSSLP